MWHTTYHVEVFPILLTNHILNFPQNDASFHMPFFEVSPTHKVHRVEVGEHGGHIFLTKNFETFLCRNFVKFLLYEKLPHLAKMSNFCPCNDHLVRVKSVLEHWQCNILH